MIQYFSRLLILFIASTACAQSTQPTTALVTIPRLSATQAGGDFTSTPARYITAAMIQAVADSAKHGLADAAENQPGITIFLPAGTINLADKPLFLGNCVTLRGAGAASTSLFYTGTGSAIRITTGGVQPVQNTTAITDLSICSADNGIGITGTNSDVIGPRLENIIVHAPHRAIDLVTNNPNQLVYDAMLRNVVVTAGSVRVKGNLTRIDHIRIINGTNAVAGETEPALELIGGGVVTGAWVEGDWGGVMVRYQGDWATSGTWYEAHFKTPRTAILLDNARVITDHTYFALPKCRWQLIDDSSLYCQTPLDAEDDNGGHPAGEDRSALLRQVYQCDASSKVFELNIQLLGSH